MRVLLVSATELEINPFLKNNKDADIMITGVGIPATVYHLTKKLFDNTYNIIIQAGIAGAFTENIFQGEVVIAEYDIFGDIGIQEKGKYTSIFETGLADKNSFPFKDGWLKNESDILKTINLKKVKAITINKINDDKKNTEMLIDYYNADIETMEGAAFHYVCLQYKIPFLQLRSISNMVGERDKNKWSMKEAINNLNKELQSIIESLK